MKTNEDVCYEVLASDISREWDAASVVEFAVANKLLVTSAVDQIRVMRSAMLNGAKKGRFIKLARRGYFQLAGAATVSKPKPVEKSPATADFPTYMNFKDSLLRSQLRKYGYENLFTEFRSRIAEFMAFASNHLQLPSDIPLKVRTKSDNGLNDNNGRLHWQRSILDAAEPRKWKLELIVGMDSMFEFTRNGYDFHGFDSDAWLDILRVFAHELTHFRQAITGQFRPFKGVSRNRGGKDRGLRMSFYREDPMEKDANINSVNIVAEFMESKGRPLSRDMLANWQDLARNPFTAKVKEYVPHPDPLAHRISGVARVLRGSGAVPDYDLIREQMEKPKNGYYVYHCFGYTLTIKA